METQWMFNQIIMDFQWIPIGYIMEYLLYIQWQIMVSNELLVMSC